MSESTGGTDGDAALEEASFVEYGIEDKPPVGESVLLGFQHYLTMIGANIAVPLALAGAMKMPPAQTAQFIGTFFVVSGVATLAQTTFGNRYPIVQGATFSMLAPALAIIGVIGAGWRVTLLELQGAVIAASAVEVLVGYLGLMGRLKKHLSPVVIAPTIALIGLSLFSVPQITAANQNWWLVGLTLGLIVLFSQYLDNHRALPPLPGPPRRRDGVGHRVRALLHRVLHARESRLRRLHERRQREPLPTGHAAPVGNAAVHASLRHRHVRGRRRLDDRELR